MGKITQFLESSTWDIIRCVLFLALFIYLTITQIAQLPGTKHLVLIFISVFGILVEVVDLVKAFKAKAKDR